MFSPLDVSINLIMSLYEIGSLEAVLYMPFLLKWPFIPEDLLARKIKALQYVCCCDVYK